MSADRDLLELAAKAAGYDVIWNEHWQCYQHRNPAPDKNGSMRHPWTPDSDDGDALRLAVALRIDVMFHGLDGLTAQSIRRIPDCAGDGAEFDSGDGDDCNATRYAIVRAAAEIGRAMRLNVLQTE